jgi:hypothetical protein
MEKWKRDRLLFPQPKMFFREMHGKLTPLSVMLAEWVTKIA